MRTTLRVRRGTAATWTAANPILALGEPGLETDTDKLKFGDGVTHWNVLPYFAGGGGGAGPAGPPGRDGATMPLRDGRPGAWGFPGPKGDKGDQGPAGGAGGVGPAGPQGATGPTGMPGFDGRPGPWGFPGPKGDVGATGAQGNVGATGATGATGMPGRDGLRGSWGFPGPQGDKGAQGIQGVQGNPGTAGAQGVSGPPGFDGKTGRSGLEPVVQLVTARDVGNGNTADVVANAADTYLLGVELTRALKAGSAIYWRFRMTKTAAGAAAPSFTVRGGVNGSTADAALVALALAGQTAVADDGWGEIVAVLRSVGTAAVLNASLNFSHTLATTGLSTTQFKTLSGNSAGFDTTVKPLRIGISCNPGLAGVWTFQTVAVNCFNLQPLF